MHNITSENPKLNLTDLPEEILTDIIDQLDINDVIELSKTNKLFRRICLDEAHWCSMTQTHFPNDYVIEQYLQTTQNKKVIWLTVFYYACQRDYKSLSTIQIKLRHFIKDNKLSLIKELKNLSFEDLQKTDDAGLSALDYAGKLADKKIITYLFSNIIVPKFKDENTNWLYWIAACGLTLNYLPIKTNVNLSFNDHAGPILESIARTDNIDLFVELLNHIPKLNLGKLLIESSKHGAIRIIDHLLTHLKVNVNHNWTNGSYTALQAATLCNQFSAVSFLLNKGAKINDDPTDRHAYAYFSQGSPLRIAVREQHLALVIFLLNQGASTEFNLNRSTEMHGIIATAIASESPSLIKLFIHSPGAIQDFCVLTSKIDHRTDLSIFKKFIHYGINLQAIFENRTPLQFAVVNPKFPATELGCLIQNFNDIFRTDPEENTLLHLANSTKILETLIALDKEHFLLQKVNISGNLPLHFAIINNKKNIFLRLLSLSLDLITHQNIQGDNLLHLLIKHHHLSWLKEVPHQVDVSNLLNIANQNGKTPEQLATEFNCLEEFQKALLHVMQQTAIYQKGGINQSFWSAEDDSDDGLDFISIKSHQNL